MPYFWQRFDFKIIDLYMYLIAPWFSIWYYTSLPLWILLSNIDGWMKQFYVLFNSISVILGQWEDYNERLCAIESLLRLRKFRFEPGSNSRPPDQQASAWPTELPGLLSSNKCQYLNPGVILFSALGARGGVGHPCPMDTFLVSD